MAVLPDKTEARRGALRVLLVGDAEDRRLEVKTGLAALGDPPLDVVRDLDIGVFSPIGINRTSRHMINLGCSLSCRNTD